eukprot:Plantae.Rhodophyta-Rhodochaete_pulchella.ctg2632.p1 GENE.Plantae.Rhodophyta-Rhodochaete_pulchella.ctg2632~~Plantae.Rhodophyta-Rhodochaete_pulchella.ctg2632.p1  ORF type:complete len:481 (+),score=88.32 Plantae.Rhodophyta-Rhodochaete_pulchella.ctg2632:101-1444(+)
MDLRYGAPVAYESELEKKGRAFGRRVVRYFRLRDGALYNHRKRGSAPTWAVSVIDCRVLASADKTALIISLYDGKVLTLYPRSREICEHWEAALNRASKRKIGTYYGVTGIIGMGAFAEVRLGYDKESGEQVAIKIMKKNKKDRELMKSVESEIHFIRKNIHNPYVVRTFDVFNTKDNLFIVMEYLGGGMLYDILSAEGQFSEAHASEIMREIMSGLKCLHDHDIVHRDIKPENVLCCSREWPYRVKLADFGLADFVLEDTFGDKCTRGMYGTPYFVAPEVIRGEPYGAPVDVWSCGVLLYNMLSGELPFDGANIKEVLKRVKIGSFDFPDSEWANISDEVKDLIQGLLAYNPKVRLTAKQALEHPWLTSSHLNTEAIANDRGGLSSQARGRRTASMAMEDVVDTMHADDDDTKFSFGKMNVFFSRQGQERRSKGESSGTADISDDE